jgi:hypothetical protein
MKRERESAATLPLQLRIEPLTPELWPALEDLFGERLLVHVLAHWNRITQACPTSTGYTTTFPRLGFKEIARHSPSAPSCVTSSSPVSDLGGSPHALDAKT